MRRNLPVDLVRTAAIATVMAGHLGYSYLTQSSSPLLDTLWYRTYVSGHYGVSMFFVVSGYLITGVLAGYRRGLFHPDLRDFYSRRVGRIVPLLGLVCLLGVALILAMPSGDPAYRYCFQDTGILPGPWFWLSIATFWQNWYQLFAHISGMQWAILWSLSVEEQFYFFYPVCLFWLGDRKRYLIFLSFFILLGPLSRWVVWELFSRNSYTPVQFNSFSGFGMIALGGLLWLVEGKARTFLEANRPLRLPLALLGLLIAARIYYKQPYFADVTGRIWDNSLLAGGIFLFLLAALPMRFPEILAWAALPGKLSYGMYLLHPMVLYFLWGLLRGKDPFLAFTLYFLATTAVAWISYRFFEWPVNLWVRRKWGTTRV
jgi:peptidoglycan/LPS O-acetylase OafA/YrhL